MPNPKRANRRERPTVRPICRDRSFSGGVWVTETKREEEVTSCRESIVYNSNLIVEGLERYSLELQLQDYKNFFPIKFDFPVNCRFKMFI